MIRELPSTDMSDRALKIAGEIIAQSEHGWVPLTILHRTDSVAVKFVKRDYFG
jgi:hypothetical protein